MMSNDTTILDNFEKELTAMITSSTPTTNSVADGAKPLLLNEIGNDVFAATTTVRSVIDLLTRLTGFSSINNKSSTEPVQGTPGRIGALYDASYELRIEVAKLNELINVVEDNV